MGFGILLGKSCLNIICWMFVVTHESYLWTPSQARLCSLSQLPVLPAGHERNETKNLRYRLWQKRLKLKTLNGRLPLEDSSDFDDFWTELILMTRSIIWDTLRFWQKIFVSGDRRGGGRWTAVPWSSDVCFRTKIIFFMRSIGQSIDWTIDRSTIDESFF